jgi:CheY-like chemotaxis protein/HPt (histidine-containing phosphotransfer) domain-containing protein
MPDNLLGTMPQQPSPQRILIIDDDAMSRELLTLLLEEENYTVTSAESGEAALDYIRNGNVIPDIVLADVQLPGIGGAQLALQLRNACGPATLLLAMSGSQPPNEAIADFDVFLLKPFKLQQITQALLTAKSPPAATSESASPKGTKPASKKAMESQLERRSSSSIESAQIAQAPVLNETIYRQLAASMPPQTLHEMYTMCVNDARRRITGMRKLAAGRDHAMFRREAHAIKGGCGMLGATELHCLAARLEVDGPDGSPDAVNSLDELSSACDRLERMLGSRV